MGGTIVGRSRNVVWGKGKVVLKVVKGLTRTVGREVGRLSSVPGGVWDRWTNRKVGRGLITRGISGVGGMGGEGTRRQGGGGARETMGEGGYIGALDLAERAGVVGDGIGSTGG